MLQPTTLASAINSKALRNDLLDATAQKLQALAKEPMTETLAKKVAKDFESMFVSQMLEHMFSGESLGTEQFGSEESEEIYRSMMVDEYSKAIVKGGGMGIANYIERSLMNRALLQTQEVNHANAHSTSFKAAASS